MVNEELYDGHLKCLLERYDACHKEVSIETVEKIILEVGLPIDATVLRDRLSAFISDREYHRRFGEAAPSTQRDTAKSVKGHTDALLKLLINNPRFGWDLAGKEDVAKRIELIQGLAALSILADCEVNRVNARADKKAIENSYGALGTVVYSVPSDSAMDLICWDLWTLFRECFGRKPGLSSTTSSNEPGGPFVRFCQAIHKKIYSLADGEQLSGFTVRKALARRKQANRRAT